MRRLPKPFRVHADTSYEGLWRGGKAQVPITDFEMLGHWVQWLHGQDLAEGTRRLYTYGVFRLFDFHRWAVPPASINEGHVAAFLESLGGRAVARVHYFRGIRSFFRFLLVRRLVKSDPTVELRPRKPRRPPTVALTEAELTQYLIAAAWRHPRRAWTLLLVFSIGTRRMEAAEIRPEDIQGDVVHLRVCKYGKQRRVELNGYARAALEGLRPWWNGTVLGGVRKEAITEWAHQAAVDSGLLPKVRGRVAHVLRASFASHLLARGADVVTVRDLMGHESIATTNSYAAVLDLGEARLKAVRRLDFGAAQGA